MTEASHRPSLLVVGTPIGNLGDISSRAIDALTSADSIFCEDTRVTGKLLAALEIGNAAKPRRMDENMLSSGGANEVIHELSSGRSVAYCTDAGMPGVSDPGQRLVDAVMDAGYAVSVIPGPTAESCALAASGIRANATYFGGFLPRKEGDLKHLLESLSSLDAALIFYESPRRILFSLDVISMMFPDREIAVCRELTKLHEEVVRGAAADISREFVGRESIKGEIALVIGPPAASEAEMQMASRRRKAAILAERLLDEGVSSRIVMDILQETCGISRNEAYRIAHRNGSESDYGQSR